MKRWIGWAAVAGLFSLLALGQAQAQSYVVGRNGWRLERLSGDFVLLRADVLKVDQAKGKSRQGLLILACERGARRVRFQIGETPLRPSTRPSQQGSAIIRIVGPPATGTAPAVHSEIWLFEDGSFEFRENPFGNPVMRAFLALLQRLPGKLEIVVFKEAKTFLRGIAFQFEMHGLDEALGQIYGFEGLCFRAPR